MANTDGNGYTVGFSIVMVIVVGAILSSLAMALKPIQDANDRDKKQIDILSAVNVEATRTNAKELYPQYIKSSVVINSQGEIVAEPKDAKGAVITAFDVDIKKDFRDKTKTPADLNYPVFLAEKDGAKYFIVPMVGKGLWGPVWGFIAVDYTDGNTIFGATFDHKTETPGLGSEIKETSFESQFVGKKIYNDSGIFKSVKIIKGGADASNMHAVSAITGGTITSNGVGEMIKRTLKIYGPYLKANAGK